jgi:dienelactone hydrolase
MTAVSNKVPVLTAVVSLVAAAAIVMLVGKETSAHAATAGDRRAALTELPNSAVGRQTQWLIDASARLPLSDEEIHAHFAQAIIDSLGRSAAQVNANLNALFGAAGAQLEDVLVTTPTALVAVVEGQGGRVLLLTMVVDRAGLIAVPTDVIPRPATRRVALPSPSGTFPIGSDVLKLVDRLRGGRRVIVTRWYPATPSARTRPLVDYASPRLSTLLGLPQVRVHAHRRARALPGRRPVVLFSPGLGTPRIVYQGLAEDLASHGYLVIAVDHNETAFELPDGHIELPSWGTGMKNFAVAVRRQQRLRVQDLRLVLRRLSTMPRGPVPDLTRIASIGHSLGGSTSAALMRVDSRIRAGMDLDGSIFGGTEKLGVTRPFMVLAEPGLDQSVRTLLDHSTGPRFELTITGLSHGSFSDGPVLDPRPLDRGKWRSSVKDIVIQGVYVRAFLDRYVLGLASPLLDGPSSRYPRVKFTYRALG